MKKLAVVVTHPIQYYVPVFRLLSKHCNLKVFYTWGIGGIEAKHDPGFGKTIAWDLPLLEGYDYQLLENVATNPGSHHGRGIVNPHLISQVENFAPNAILVYGYIYHSHFQLLKYFKGKIPLWFRGDSTLIDKEPKWKAFAKKIYLNWVYSHVDKAFYVGTNNKHYFEKFGLKKNKQLTFAPHAIDNERFGEARTLEAAQLRKKLGIDAKDILILFAGKLEPKKNPDLLLEAYIRYLEQQTKEKHHNSETNVSSKFEPKEKCKVYLLFVGNGVLEEKLKAKVNQFNDEIASCLEMTHTVSFMDFQNQTHMPVIYQACDIFCLPSRGPGETWGLAINEAMAAKKAILASDKVGCAIDLVKPGINGYVFKSGDVDDLIAKIKLLLLKPSTITSFGNNSEAIIKEWSFKGQVKQFINALNETN